MKFHCDNWLWVTWKNPKRIKNWDVIVDCRASETVSPVCSGPPYIQPKRGVDLGSLDCSACVVWNGLLEQHCSRLLYKLRAYHSCVSHILRPIFWLLFMSPLGSACKDRITAMESEQHKTLRPGNFGQGAAPTPAGSTAHSSVAGSLGETTSIPQPLTVNLNWCCVENVKL